MINLKKIILSCFLLCAFTSIAQSRYVFYKPVDTINAILSKNPNVFYVEKGAIIRNIKKIQANINGKIKIMNVIYTEVDTSAITSIPQKEVFLDLFKYETMVIHGSQIHFKDKGNNTYRTIYGFNNDIQIFKKQLESIKKYCQKNKAIDYIKRYYFDFKTGYNTPGGFFTVTDNYKVKLVNSIFTISFDTYRFREFIKKETITFDLKDVLSIYNKGTVYVEFDNGFVLYPVSSSIGFKSKSINYSLNIKLDKQTQTENTEIYKAFEELLKLYNQK
jgi:hypothetical protein